MSDSLSFNKARWRIPDVDLSAVEQVVRRHDLPEVAARMLLARGISGDEIASFLSPTLKSDLPSPFSLAGMEAMAKDVADAIAAGKRFAIFGDFDVDGATSSAVLYRFLKACGVEAPIYIPGRLTEGYGPNTEALQSLRDDGAEILFLLDCGTTAFDVVRDGAQMGLDIVILDHHEAEDELPVAKHVVNPKRKDDTSGTTMLAAVGVTFMACIAINNKLREAGFYQERGIKEPDLMALLDLVALGTVCDMVPLLGVNRLFVRRGFEVMKVTQNTGLKELIKVSRIDEAVSTYHCGFILGPRINAGSRVHKSDLGAKLLAHEDVQEANNIAWTLNDCNEKRKAIQSDMEREAIAQVEMEGLEEQPVIFVASESFHQGLSGLVAGRLKEKYKKPAVVVAIDLETGEGRGSGRSVPGIHIAQSFIDARNESLLSKGGGHAMAGGFTVDLDQLDAFQAYMCTHIAKQFENTDPNVETELDGVLSVRGATSAFVHLLEGAIGPFGQEFPEPLFVFRNVRVRDSSVVGEAHIRVMMSDWEGGSWMKAMAFRAVDTELGNALMKADGKAFDIVGRLKINRWNGRESVELHIVDAMACLL